jgi:hypothetical protein
MAPLKNQACSTIPLLSLLKLVRQSFCPQNGPLSANKFLDYYEGPNQDTRPDLNLSTSRLVPSEQLRAHAKYGIQVTPDINITTAT